MHLSRSNERQKKYWKETISVMEYRFQTTLPISLLHCIVTSSQLKPGWCVWVRVVKCIYFFSYFGDCYLYAVNRNELTPLDVKRRITYNLFPFRVCCQRTAEWLGWIFFLSSLLTAKDDIGRSISFVVFRISCRLWTGPNQIGVRAISLSIPSTSRVASSLLTLSR